MSDGRRRVQLVRWHDGVARADDDAVIEECAIALSYNGVAHAVMMATPTDLEDFALGFSVHEGIVSSRDELTFIEANQREDGVVVELAIRQVRADALAARARRTLGSSACGVCGSEALIEALPVPGPVVAGDVDFGDIARALRHFTEMQALNAVTGGAHAAAWCIGADVRVLREDVGRHNAFDKLGGALLRSGIDVSVGYAMVSSRASYELVHKAATSGIGTLVAMSAPTSAAIDVANRCGLRLVGFARDSSMNVY